MCKSLKLYFASLIVLAMCTLSAMAQSTTTGAIGGTVMNPAKEVVPGASVSVKHAGIRSNLFVPGRLPGFLGRVTELLVRDIEEHGGGQP